MQRSNHRDRQTRPDHRDLLPLVCGAIPVRAWHQLFFGRAAKHLTKAANVDTCTKGFAFTREHRDPRIRGCDLFTRSNDRRDHILIHRVHLVAAGQAHMRNVIFIGDGYAGHDVSPFRFGIHQPIRRRNARGTLGHELFNSAHHAKTFVIDQLDDPTTP